MQLPAGQVRWLNAQQHAAENIGDTATHTIFVELTDEGGADRPRTGGIGPVGG